MVIGKRIREHTNASGVTSYFMYELHYTYSGIKYSIDKYSGNIRVQRLLMPVKDKRIAEAVWAELANNDWRC